MKLLSIDPGTTNMGWAVFNYQNGPEDGLRAVHLGEFGVIKPTISTKARKDIHNRVWNLCGQLQRLIKMQNPTRIYIEYPYVSKLNFTTSLTLVEVLGMYEATIFGLGDLYPCEVATVRPAEWKALLWKGNMSKHEIVFLLSLLFERDFSTAKQDAVDAIGIGLAYFYEFYDLDVLEAGGLYLPEESRLALKDCKI